LRFALADFSNTVVMASSHLTYNHASMKAYVYVSLKKSVLDPQGKTIHGALKKMGYKGLEEVRQGKYFELTLDGGLSREQAQTEVERIAREVLTNPVIEEFRCSLAD
jgi:phosphoribosylformylglycinamidine synthase subunit PurS